MKIYFPEISFMYGASEEQDLTPLQSIGELAVEDLHDPEFLGTTHTDAAILIIGRLPLTRETLKKFPNLKLVVKSGTGVDKIDLAGARECGVSVVNIPGYGAEPVGQATMGYILNFASCISAYAEDVKQKRWNEAQYTHRMTLVKDKCLGVIGLGSISRHVIKLATAFGMHICVHTRHPDRDLAVEYVDTENLARKSDFITVHCIHDNYTRGLVDERFLSQVKPTVYIVNTARAAVIDHNAITKALREKRVAGLALDVFWNEPPDFEHELFSMPNVIINPHVSWSPLETRQWMIGEMAALMRDFVAGRVRNLVN